MAEVFTGVNASLERQIEQLKRLSDIEQDLRNQIAQANGDELEQENARYQKALDDLKAEATTAEGFNAQQYAKLKKLEDELHALKLKHIKEQSDAQTAASGSGEGRGAASTGGGDRPSTPQQSARPSSPPSTQPSNGAAKQLSATGAGITINITNPTFLSGSSKEADQFIRFVKKGLGQLAKRS